MAALHTIRHADELTARDALPGTYALVFHCTAAEFPVGRLGTLRLAPGWYVYVGSAFGPGGVRGRLLHHLRPSPRPHWHVDYLKQFAELEEVWFVCSRRVWEHRWAHFFSAARGARLPMAGFGSSDCKCAAHLVGFRRRPAMDGLRRLCR
ncbi:MAG: GIY-YIG nuclease family protein [Acidobacteriota bacterium]|nr:GIY-YIG nuclease family protein [Acidobacteriota bacterium]